MRSSTWLGARTILVVAVVLALLGVPGPATAGWDVRGVGAGRAATAALAAADPVTAEQLGEASPDVLVQWIPPSVPSGAITGFYVVRVDGDGNRAAVCDSGPGADELLDPSETECIDLRVPAGTYRYQVHTVWRSWTSVATSPPLEVVRDPFAPRLEVRMLPAPYALLRNNRVYVRTGVAGSFQLVAALTDFGSGPASVTFPLINRRGWTHPAENVTVGVGAGPTIEYTSSPYRWTAGAQSIGRQTIVGFDRSGNRISTILTYQTDNRPPTGGQFSVNGVLATVATPQSVNASGPVTFSRTDYVEALNSRNAGLESSILEIYRAALVNGTCQTFPATPSSYVPSGLPPQPTVPGCYRYVLRGTDLLGNTVARSIVLRFDNTPPIGAALRINGVDATVEGSSSTSAGPSLSITRSPGTDPESGTPTGVLTRARAPIVNGVCGTYGAPSAINPGTTEVAPSPPGCYRYSWTSTNPYGLAAQPLVTTVVVGAFVTALETRNAGTSPGVIEPGDQVILTLNQPLRPSSLCSTMPTSGDGSVSTTAFRVRVTEDPAGDRLTLSTPCAAFGTLLLNGDYVAATADFGGTVPSSVVYNDAARQITITFGAPPSGFVPRPPASSAPSYTAPSALRTPDNVAFAGTFTATPGPQF